MCDTFIALSNTTHDGSVLFSKNSDREPDEAQAIIHIPSKANKDKSLKCTYIEIPPAEKTYECMLSKPFQMWGAEMGVNEHGVVIGNEAVFTKVKFEKHNQGLTGMDMLRLALERSQNADEALQCITKLLEQYGQNACGGYKNKKFYYHNSFIIADADQAWILETAGKAWAAEKVKEIRSISNALSIHKADLLSADAKSFAASKGWWKTGKEFSFAQAYSDWLYTTVGRAKIRSACTMQMAGAKKNQLQLADCIGILQTHNIASSKFKPSKANTGSICMHATSFLNPSTTTGSMVAVIRKDKPHSVWLSGTSMPCLSVYLPFYFGTDVLSSIKQPGAIQDNSLWWKAEQLHQWICKDYQKRKALMNDERESIQKQFIEEEAILLSTHPGREQLHAFSSKCYLKFMNTLENWLKLID